MAAVSREITSSVCLVHFIRIFYYFFPLSNHTSIYLRRYIPIEWRGKRIKKTRWVPYRVFRHSSKSKQYDLRVGKWYSNERANQLYVRLLYKLIKNRRQLDFITKHCQRFSPFELRILFSRGFHFKIRLAFFNRRKILAWNYPQLSFHSILNTDWNYEQVPNIIIKFLLQSRSHFEFLPI